MRFIAALLVLWLGMAGSVVAKEHGKGHGKGHGHSMGAGATNDVQATEGTRPPGLSRQDKLPPGLERKDKTPPGWTKGKKKGWWWKKKQNHTVPEPSAEQ